MISDLKITLDGFVLSDYFDLTEEPDRGFFPNVTNTTKQISRLNGVRVSQIRFEERYIKLSLYALSGNFREMKDRLAVQLFKEGNQKLWFSDEPDRFFWVKLNGESSLKRSLEYREEAYGTLEFICEDGLAHAIQTKDFQLVDDSVVIQNEGTYKAPITWTVDFLADCESIGFVTEDRILQLGYVTSEDIDEDLSNVVLFNDPMKSATSGQYSRNVGKIRWRNDSGDNTSQIQGSLKYEADAITVDSYGPSGADDAFWHGPTLTRFFNDVEDCEIYARFNFKPNGATKDKAKKQGLFELNLVDADNLFICGFEMKDNTDQQDRVEYKFYVGDAEIKSGFLPAAVRNTNGGFFGMIRIRKVGNNFDFYLARLVNNPKGGFNESWKATHNWTNEATAMLKPTRVDINFLNWRNKQPIYQSLTHLKLTKFNTRDDKLIPKTFLEGDQLIFDGSTSKVTINGITANDYFVVGSQPIISNIGETEVFISHESAVDPLVTATVEERFL